MNLFPITYHFPEFELTNDRLSELFTDTSPEQIFKMSGIRKRYLAIEELPSDLVVACAEKFFDQHGIDKSNIDYIIFVAEIRDYCAPATACILQDRMGLRTDIGAIDVPLGCTGFVTGLGLAKALVDSGMAKNVLLATAETSTQTLHPKDLATRMLFSDAACVTLISCENSGSIGKFVHGTDGTGWKDLFIESSHGRNPVDSKWIEEHKDANGMLVGKMHMDGAQVLRFSLKIVPQLVSDILEKNQLKFDEIDLFIFHQPSGIILKFLRRKIKIPEERFMEFIVDVGNTVSCTIPIAISEAQKSGRIKPGNKVMLVGFGIGSSWGGTIINY